MRQLFALLLVCLVTTFAAAGTHGPREAAYWQGKSINEIIARLGNADQIIHHADGESVYIYQYPHNNPYNLSQAPGTTTVFAARGQAIGIAIPAPGPYRIQDNCSATFITNAQKIIVKTSQSGSCSDMGNALDGPGN